MPTETFLMADRSVASIEEPVRKEKIRKDLLDLLLDLDRKFESVLKLKEKFKDDDDDSQVNEEGLVDQTSRSTLRRTTSHEAFPIPSRPRPRLQYGHGHHEMLARRYQARLQAKLACNDSDDSDVEDDDASFCSRDSSKLRCGRKRAQRLAAPATKEGQSSTLERAGKLEAVPLSPVGTMITWNREEEEVDDLDDVDEAFLFVEDCHDQDTGSKRRCSSYF